MTPRQAHSGRPRCNDAGETLVELLVSMVIIGIAVTTILGGVAMGSSSSSLHRDHAKVQNLLRNWAEELTFKACQPYTDAALYPSFKTSSTPDAAGYLPLTDGYKGKVSAISYTSMNTTTGALTWGVSPCSASTDGGLQLVTLTITNTGTPAVSNDLKVVLRKACAPTSTSNPGNSSC